jgi:hypothetical protein
MGREGRNRSAKQSRPIPSAQAAPAVPRRWWESPIVAAALLVLITLAAYLPALGNGYIWDDDMYVTANQTLHSAEGLRQIWFQRGATVQYYPLVFTSFWVEYQLWQLQPFGYHLVNVLLHGAGVVLLWLVLRRLSVPGAYLAAAVFALHPVHVESVAWITERKNVLSGFFYLAAFLAYLRFTPLDSARPTWVRHWRYYGLAFALFLCALLSKSVTGSLPAAIALAIWWKRDRLTARDLLPLAPMLLVGVLMGCHTSWMEKHRVGAQGMDWSLPVIERLLIAGRAVWFYLGKLLWPSKLTFIYPRWLIAPERPWQYVFWVSAVAVPITAWLLRKRVGKAPLAAVLFFGGTLLPALGFVNLFPMLYSFVADHFQYLASIGPIALLVGVLAVFAEQLRVRLAAAKMRMLPARAVPVAAYLSAVVLLIVLGRLTWGQCAIYKSEETLWRDTIAKNPRAAMAKLNLGNILVEQRKLDEAITLFREVTEMDPRGIPPIILARGYNNLGNTVGLKGDFTQAVEQYRQALRVHPGYVNAHYGLGWALSNLGRTDEAIAEYRRTLEMNPGHGPAKHALDLALREKNASGQ